MRAAAKSQTEEAKQKRKATWDAKQARQQQERQLEEELRTAQVPRTVVRVF